MKNLFSALGMVLAASFSLVSCAEDRLAPVDNAAGAGVPFEISTVITKTSNEGTATKWAEGDNINLFHAVAGATTYTSDGEFTIDEGLAGKFSGTLASALTDGTKYDWYANYPYSSYQKTPAGVSKDTGAYITIGGTAQTQKGNSSTAHLSGNACPLYGVAKSVASDEKPVLTMKNLASVVAIEVTNTLDDDLTVTSVAFTSTESIVGQYFIDYSGDTPAYAERSSSTVSATANLTVSGGTAIAKGKSAIFYIAIKPHTVKSGSDIVVSVNGISKTLTLTKDVTFTAGSRKPIAYNYEGSKVAGQALPFVEDFSAYTYENTTEAAKAVAVTNYSSKFSSFTGVYGGDEDGVLKLGASKSAGSMVTIPLDLSAESTVIIRAKKYSSDNVAIRVTVNGVNYDTDKLSADDYQDYYINLPAVNNCVSVTITSDITSKGRYYIDNLKIVSGKVVAPEPPVITPASTAETLEYNDETVHEIAVTVTGQEGDVSCGVYDDADGKTECTWCVADYADGKVSYSAESNTGSVARTAYIILSATNSDGTTKSKIVVTQGVNTAGVTSYTLEFGSDYNSKGVSSYTDAAWAATCSGTTWNIVNLNNNNNQWKYVKAGSKSAASVATITTKSALSLAVSTVTITIDAVTVKDVNSIYLQVSASDDFSYADKIVLSDVAEGDNTITISSPAVNRYYKLSFDMAKDKNGTIQISKVVYK